MSTRGIHYHAYLLASVAFRSQEFKIVALSCGTKADFRPQAAV
jgi:hypothetical protein